MYLTLVLTTKFYITWLCTDFAIIAVVAFVLAESVLKVVRAPASKRRVWKVQRAGLAVN